MADVRLTATNPVDSSVVPVAANSRGELLIESPTVDEINNDVTINGDLTVTGLINGGETPTIDEINNDVTINGDLTVTGLINGSDGSGDGGIDLPPNPGEGQVLGWVNGELAWVDPPSQPEPVVGLPTPFGPEESFLQIVGGEPAWQAVWTGHLPPRVWSDFVTLSNESGSWTTDFPKTQAFDGNTQTYGQVRSDSGNIVFAPNTPLGVIEKFEVWVGPNDGSIYAIDFDGSTDQVEPGDDWREVGRMAGKEWTESSVFEIRKFGSTTGYRLHGLRLNGEIFIDRATIRRGLLDDLMARLEALERK